MNTHSLRQWGSVWPLGELSETQWDHQSADGDQPGPARTGLASYQHFSPLLSLSPLSPHLLSSEENKFDYEKPSKLFWRKHKNINFILYTLFRAGISLIGRVLSIYLNIQSGKRYSALCEKTLISPSKPGQILIPITVSDSWFNSAFKTVLGSWIW